MLTDVHNERPLRKTADTDSIILNDVGKNMIKRRIERRVIEQNAQDNGEYYIPAAVSNRHIHLSAADVKTLFGTDYTLTPLRPLSQPGQYSCSETLTVAGVKGRIERVRISNEEAAVFGLKNGDVISAKKTGERETIFGNILVRADKMFSLELQLDTDEANTGHIKNGDLLEMIKSHE